MEEVVLLEQRDAADWIYRGEGAANIVLAYTGSSTSYVGKVLRVQKAPRNESSRGTSPTALSEHERLVWRDTADMVSSPNKRIAFQLYVQRVMSPLLGPKYVDAGRRVQVAREFLQLVEENINCQRPAWRVDASKVDSQCDSALLMTDHSLISHGGCIAEPCISVEIKPKCGLIPFSRFISEGNAIKRSISRFRMHQALKLHQGEISKLSKYDPLDLFSKSKDRIQRAIVDLFATPQNNFRVFLNGSLIFGALGCGMASTSVEVGEVGEAFEDALKSLIKAEDGLRTTNFLQLVSETVYQSGVLNQLLEVQKLDNFDIEGAIHAYYNITSESCPICRELDKEEVSHTYASLHSISLEESLKIVKDYLIAATAKDCSLMFSFTPSEDGGLGCAHNKVYLESTNQSFDYKASFIDLDLKPLKKMENYFELDKKIVTCYTRMLEADQEADGGL